MPKTVDILDVDDSEMEQWLETRGQSSYRRRQILSWIFERSADGFADMTNLPVALRSELYNSFHIGGRQILALLRSSDGSAEKLLIRLDDGQKIETVTMRYRYGIAVCISSQVGCKVGCPFCASGARGFVRNLTAGEMLAQVVAVNRSLPLGDRVSSVVVMGMGEPLDNFDNLVRFLNLAHDPDRLGISFRRVTVSTAGVVPRIRDLASLRIPITLAVSLHAPTDALRDRLVPLNRAYPIALLIDSVKEYSLVTDRRVTFEYALIKDVNDTSECASQLAKLVRGLLCHVNLIRLNPTGAEGMTRSERVEEFAAVLRQNGIEVTTRRELGIDIDAACGQLRARHEP